MEDLYFDKPEDSEEEDKSEKEFKDDSETTFIIDEPAPLPMKSYEEFGKNYKKGNIILNASDFTLFSGEENESKKEVIIKEYKEEFINKIKDFMNLFNYEISCFENFNKNNFKYICKYLNGYKTDNKIFLVFEKFNTTLKNELIKKKNST